MQKIVAEELKKATAPAREAFELHESWRGGSAARAAPAPAPPEEEEEDDEEEEEQEDEEVERDEQEDEDETDEAEHQDDFDGGRVQQDPRPQAPQTLAGGFRIGQTIYSLISHSHSTGDIEFGSRGVVKGPGNEPHRLLCYFDSGLRINVLPSQLSAEEPVQEEEPVDSEEEREREERARDPERLARDPEPYPAKAPTKHLSLSDHDLEMQAAFGQGGVEALEDGNRLEALERFSKAIEIGNPPAALYAKRADVLLKLKRPCACISDCGSAIEINPDSAKAYRTRGKAYRKLGQWEEAYNDIALSQKLDFDDDTSDLQQFLAEKMAPVWQKRRDQRLLEEERLQENMLRRRKAHEERTQAAEAAAEAKARAEAIAREERSWSRRCSRCARRMRGGAPPEDAGRGTAEAGSAQDDDDDDDCPPGEDID